MTLRVRGDMWSHVEPCGAMWSPMSRDSQRSIPEWNSILECVCVCWLWHSPIWAYALRLNKVSLHSPDVGVPIAKTPLRAHTHSRMEFHSGMEQKSYLMKGCVAEGVIKQTSNLLLLRAALHFRFAFSLCI